MEENNHFINSASIIIDMLGGIDEVSYYTGYRKDIINRWLHKGVINPKQKYRLIAMAKDRGVGLKPEHFHYPLINPFCERCWDILRKYKSWDRLLKGIKPDVRPELSTVAVWQGRKIRGDTREGPRFRESVRLIKGVEGIQTVANFRAGWIDNGPRDPAIIQARLANRGTDLNPEGEDYESDT